MQPSVVNLRQFYTSPLGRKARARLRALMQGFWNPLHMAVGVGYATPFLPGRMRRGFEEKSLALMPTEQGALYWPIDGANRSVLGDTLRPPFATQMLERVLVVHGLEREDSPDEFLRIWWHLLAPGGRMMLVVPNRHGLWVRFGATPFKSGIPYSSGTLRHALNDAGFTVRDTRTALFAPPSNHGFWLSVFRGCEWLGRLLCPHWGGVIVMVAEKQIFAGLRVTAHTKKPEKSWVPSPALGRIGQNGSLSQDGQ